MQKTFYFFGFFEKVLYFCTVQMSIEYESIAVKS